MWKALRDIATAGLIVGIVLTVLGVLANWLPALDVFNNGFPFLAVGALALLAVALLTRGRILIAGTATLFTVILLLLFAGLRGGVPEAPEGTARLLRVATFNLSVENKHVDAINDFLLDTNPDVLVLQEARTLHKDLLALLKQTYPYRIGDSGLMILSKHRAIADGRVDRASGSSPIIRWVKLDLNGSEVTVAGAHLARPFNPALQQADINSLTQFVLSQSGALVLAGDFNMTPWTVKLKTFTAVTRLHRFNTFRPTCRCAGAMCDCCRSPQLTMFSPHTTSPRSASREVPISDPIIGLSLPISLGSNNAQVERQGAQGPLRLMAVFPA